MHGEKVKKMFNLHIGEKMLMLGLYMKKENLNHTQQIVMLKKKGKIMFKEVLEGETIKVRVSIQIVFYGGS